MNAFIAGLGAWYPENIRYNDAWPSEFIEAGHEKGDRTFNDIPEAIDDAAHITTRYLLEEASDPFLGTVERRFADENTTSVAAEVFAATQALEDAGLRPDQIDTVISYAVVPDRITPASAPAVATALGIGTAPAFGMDAACATALLQIKTAVALIQSGQAQNVLLTQSHLLLRTFPLLHPAAPGLGDAATAVVVSCSGRFRILETLAKTHGEFYPAVTWIRGSDDASDTPWWQPGGALRVGSRDREGAKTLQRDTVTYGVRTMKELCDQAGVDVERLALLASVEPRGWVPGAICQVLGLSASVAQSVYRTRGHLGACGPIANLEAASREGKLKNSGLAALYAQGAGFTRAGVLLQMDGND